jgi:hypothetical protein
MQNLQAQDYETVGATFNNTLRRDSDTPKQLRSAIRYMNQYGTIRRRGFSVTEHGLFRWGKNVETTGEYQFTEQTASTGFNTTTEPQLTRSHRGDAGGQHTLWGSLTSSVRVYTSQDRTFNNTSRDMKVSDNQRRGLRAGLGYRRRTNIGRLHLGFDYERAREDQTSLDRVRTVANEAHTMTDGNEPELKNSSVDVATIVVTDDTGFTVYQEGLDYSVQTFGSRVRLFRELTGTITNGQAIRVDYQFSFSPDLTFDTDGQVYSARLDTPKSWSLYYRFSRYNEDFVSGIENGFLEDRRLHVAGVSLQQGNLTIGDEYEVNEVVASEFLSNRFFGNYRRTVRRITNINLSGNYTWTRFKDVDRTLNVFSTTARITTTLRRGYLLEGQGLLRLDRGNDDAQGLDADLFSLRVGLTRRVNALTITSGLFYRNANNNNDVNDRRTNIFLSMKREF